MERMESISNKDYFETGNDQKKTFFKKRRFSRRHRTFRRRPFILETVLTEDATTLQIPEYKTLGSAGADLKALFDGEIAPGKVLSGVRTGVKIKIPRGYEGQIRPRSGLGTKGLTIVNSPGTIDSDYRGEIMITFANLGEETIKWNAGDRIAQLVICPVKRVIFNNVAEFSPDKFENTRNENGFGSTGKSN